MPGVLTHGDGIVILVSSADRHVIDDQNFARATFTPYAAFDAEHGRRFQHRSGPGYSAENWSDIPRDEYECVCEGLLPSTVVTDYRLLIGNAETMAHIFDRNERKCELLYRITPGTQPTDSEYHAVRTGSRSIDVFRLGTLQWKTGSSSTWHDFPQYLQSEYLLDREAAWKVAWVLVRAAYLDEWDTLDAILQQCKKWSSKKEAGLSVYLEKTITGLKTRRLS